MVSGKMPHQKERITTRRKKHGGKITEIGLISTIACWDKLNQKDKERAAPGCGKRGGEGGKEKK